MLVTVGDIPTEVGAVLDARAVLAHAWNWKHLFVLLLWKFPVQFPHMDIFKLLRNFSLQCAPQFALVSGSFAWALPAASKTLLRSDMLHLLFWDSELKSFLR